MKNIEPEGLEEMAALSTLLLSLKEGQERGLLKINGLAVNEARCRRTLRQAEKEKVEVTEAKVLKFLSLLSGLPLLSHLTDNEQDEADGGEENGMYDVIYCNPAEPSQKYRKGQRGRRPQWLVDWLASGRKVEDLPRLSHD